MLFARYRSYSGLLWKWTFRSTGSTLYTKKKAVTGLLRQDERIKHRPMTLAAVGHEEEMPQQRLSAV